MTCATRTSLSLPDLLAHQARAHPRRTALTDGVRGYDYRRLHAVAARVRASLHRQGVGAGDRVAILGPRDARVCALLYGVLGSGAAAVLIDPEWSTADLSRRLDAVGVGHALTTDPAVRAPGARRTEAPDLDPPDLDAVDGEDLEGGDLDATAPGVPAAAPAYLSFTSGSSGEPKAVAVTHANAAHYALSLSDRLGFDEADPPRVAHVTTFAADLGHTAWLLALATGGSAHIVPDRTARDPRAFWTCLREAGVSVLKTTPSHMRALLDGRRAGNPALHTLLLGGEALPRPLAAGLIEDGVALRVANHYGPTETTIGATCLLASAVTDLPDDEPTVPIGTALGEVDLVLLDADGRPVPVGGQGELLIGGRGVTDGYAGRPEETARRFVRYRGRRMYRTGDVCRRRTDGGLVFLGRTDRQTKIRGFRVDPAEVEWAIGEFPGVSQSAVIVRRTPAGGRLLAAVRTADGRADDATLTALRAHLRDRLPEYAVPQPIVALADFPTGPNGKLDRDRLGTAVEAAIEHRARRSVPVPDSGTAPAAPGATAPDTAAPAPDTDADPLARSLAELWAGALGLPVLHPDADVLGLGGDSLLAMRTVAFLRRVGHTVTFEDFYRHPTPALLARAARAGHASVTAPSGRDDADRDAPVRLAPAQRWLFDRSLSDPWHWNQCVLLRCGTPVDAAALSAAVRSVLHRHTALRRPVGPDGPGDPRPAARTDAVSFSRLPDRPDEVAAAVGGLCDELHRSLDPRAGRPARVHLFTGPPGVDDRIALIAHHLVVDGLSWRILLDDLAHAYRAALTGADDRLTPTADFYRWAGTRPPTDTGPGPAEPARPAAPAAPSGHAEGPAAGTGPESLTWALDEHATARLVARHGRGPGLEALLLAALADAVPWGTGLHPLTIEVETHGRDTTGEGAAYMDTVGWFTAVRHVAIDRPRRPEATGPRAEAVARLLRGAPERPMDVPGPRPDLGFNYLGTFHLPDDAALRWSVAPEPAGTARCPDGDPLYRLRLTARIIQGRLVADLVHPRSRLSDADAHDLLTAFAATVAAQAGVAPPPYHRSPVSTSGHPLLSGHPQSTGHRRPTGRAHTTAAVRVTRDPVRVLLTGATGFLGGHLLTEFLSRGAHVTCLVRGERDAEAARRLDSVPGGVDVVAGDIDQEGLGLTPAGLALAREARIVVHAAADVRLVAPPADLERTNVGAVRRLLSWIDAETAGAHLHHLSTLAVSGGVDGPARRFGEADLWIGQRFRTPYERVKFEAEETVRAWAATGRRCYIHRSGHVAAHSATGAFQRNVADNRVYQLVRGYVLAGAAPRRPRTTVAFSHVDTVAAGIAAIATHPHAVPGAYHVETPHEVPHDLLVRWLADHGYHIALTDDDAFATALADVERLHPTEARLASAWAQIEDRNVVVERAHTTSVLDRLGVRFAAPTPQWWSNALTWAADTGFLPPAAALARPLRTP